jgi:hypothetical protein
MAESFLGALNLVVQTLGRLEDVVEAAVEDASGITAWGEGLLAVIDGIRASVEVPSDLQLRVHWNQFLNLSVELGRAARLVPETLDLTPLVELEPRLVSEIDAIRAAV